MGRGAGSVCLGVPHVLGLFFLLLLFPFTCTSLALSPMWLRATPQAVPPSPCMRCCSNKASRGEMAGQTLPVRLLACFCVSHPGCQLDCVLRGAGLLVAVLVSPFSSVSYCHATAMLLPGCWRWLGFPRCPLTASIPQPTHVL